MNAAYHKGLLMFEALRVPAGDEKFFGALKDYFRLWNGKIAPADALEKSFSGCGADLSGVFESFLQGKVVI